MQRVAEGDFAFEQGEGDGHVSVDEEVGLALEEDVQEEGGSKLSMDGLC